MDIPNDGSPAGAGAPSRLAFPHIVVLALLVLLLTIDGVDMQLMGVTVAAIAVDWGLPLSAFGAAMAAGHLGAAIGAALGGMLADRIGRRATILLGVVWFGAFTLAMLLANTPDQIALVRLVAGLGMGGCLPPALALISETTPTKVRPLAVSLCILANPMGIAAAGAAASIMLPETGWRSLYLLFGLAPLVVALVALALLPESPAFLSRFPQRADELQRLMIRLRIASMPPAPARGTRSAAGFGALWGQGERVKTLSIFAAFMCAYMAMSLVLSWMPSLLTSGGFSQALAGAALSTFSLAGMAGIVLAGVLMGALGTHRIALFYIVCAAVAVGAVALALPTTSEAFAAPNAQLRFYAIVGAAGFMLNGTMTCLFAHASGVFAPAVRATGIGFAASCGRIGAIMGAFVGARVLESFGGVSFFVLVSGLLALAFVMLAAGAKSARDPAMAAAAPSGR